MSRTALVTGITGQDGSYLAELLLQKGYAVHGVTRHASSLNRARLGHLTGTALTLHHGDLTDAPTLQRLVQQVRPDEIYNLAAQSHVGVSFELPGYTMDCNALGTLRLLEAVRTLGLGGTTRFYQASTSEMFGTAATSPQTESTPFEPRSPYGVAKLAAHWIARNYREAYGVFACCGILFNHESPRRGESFVSRKITRALARMHLGLQDVLELGNLDAERDWGHARDYVEAQWLMLQQPQPDDYVIATGKRHSVREFVVAAAAALDLGLRWEGEGADERAVADIVPSGSGIRSGQTVVRLDPRHVRPIDVPALCGDAGKARHVLGWTPRTGFDALVREMVASDLALAQREARAG
ncbi:GDP-mannose 4,6-dehydratase [Chiayiivirga flava]|uniref:GDP-mannose 4,6-dehydratase n=1 Tax=Chiayiivirga flava TaxID=659595 RepID=A0A7W8D810_9GAMM|nr:GDPmannose 4,6-dehydratase [Chiayiivirga flava]